MSLSAPLRLLPLVLLVLTACPSRTGPSEVPVLCKDDPDNHEPNDTADQATPVVLTNQDGVLVGSGSGCLATAGDVDRFAFDVPAGKIVYVRLTAPNIPPPEPPPAYILSYRLLRPDGNAEFEDRVRSNMLAADLAAARRGGAAGRWQVQVGAWNSGTAHEPPPGDPRLKYTLEVKVLDEGDPNELSAGNDTQDQARVAHLSSTTSTPSAGKVSFTGRLGTMEDKDWLAVELASNTAPTVLRYRLVPLSSGGRFPPLPGPPDRRVYVLTGVSGFSASDCVTQTNVCPKGDGYGTDSTVRALVDGWCNNSTPLCLRASREESESFSHLRNFEGALPVPSHSSTTRYYFLVQNEGTPWADDKDYRLEVEWLEDPDEASHPLEGPGLPRSLVTMASDDAAATFPAPPTGAAFEVHGSISYGQGRLVGNDPVKGQGVRGPGDYEAVDTDVDTFAFQLPSAWAERTWELQWEVEHLSDGGTPHGLALDLTFCDGDRTDGGVCTPVSTGSAGQPLTLAYRGEPLRAWHSPASGPGNLQPLYTLERGATSTKVTVQPYACACFEPRFLRGGYLQVAVSGVDRTDYGHAGYTLRTAHTTYPKSYTTLDGGSASCPRPEGNLPDGGTAPGCFFTRQP